MSVLHNISIVLPTYEDIKIDFHVYPDITTVFDLMNYIYEKQMTTLVLIEMIVMHHDIKMEPTELFSAYSVALIGDSIHVLKQMNLDSSLESSISTVEYSEFLR
jgi:hypothetical protein